jgi:hypothetical protein
MVPGLPSSYSTWSNRKAEGHGKELNTQNRQARLSTWLPGQLAMVRAYRRLRGNDSGQR